MRIKFISPVWIFILLLLLHQPVIVLSDENLMPMVIVPQDRLFGGYEDGERNAMNLYQVWEYTSTIPKNQRAVARSRGAQIGLYIASGFLLSSLIALTVLNYSDYSNPNLELGLATTSLISLATNPFLIQIRDNNTYRAVHVYNNRNKAQQQQ